MASDLARSLGSVWRSLRSMRTALLLLLVVALASIAGSLVPQAPASPQRVAVFLEDHPTLGSVYRALGLFDVFGSWWFTLSYVLLMVSLVACLVPRTRGLVRALRQRPQPAREIDSLRHFAEGVVPAAPAEVLGHARRLLRRRRYRVAAADGGLAAEKGVAREAGSLAFHWSLLLLLAGVIYGKGFGFGAQATVIEGETFTEAHASYDLPPEEGRFFTESMHRGFRVRVRDFEVRYRRSGLPRDFVSRVDVLEGGELVRRAEIRVNEPLVHRGVKLYQQGYGWAPVIEVRQAGRPIASGPVVFLTGDGDVRQPWRGVLKLPSLRPQVGLELRLLPDPAAFAAGAPMLHARNPFLLFTAYRGDLRLTAAQNIFELDTRGLEVWERGTIPAGGSAELPGGLEIGFPELREYTQLRVARDPGVGLVLAAALLILAGLLPALYSSRRRVWVRASVSGGGTRVQLGGFALQRKAAFEEEFDALVRDLVGGRLE